MYQPYRLALNKWVTSFILFFGIINLYCVLIIVRIIFNVVSLLGFIRTIGSSKECMYQGRKRKKKRWNSMCSTKGWLKRSCATSGKRREHAHTGRTASSLTESRSCGRWSGTRATRPRYAAWCSPEISAHMVTAATSATLSLSRNGSWLHDHFLYHVDRLSIRDGGLRIQYIQWSMLLQFSVMLSRMHGK